jgi:hypothetical protein
MNSKKIFEVDAHWDESVKLHACHLGTFDIPGRCFLISRQRLQVWVRMDGRGTQKQLAFAEVATEDELERDEEDLEERKGVEEGKKKQRFPFEEMLKVNQGLGVETSFKDDLSQYTT